MPIDAKRLLNEVLDHFDSNNIHPDDAWAFADDKSGMGLDHRSADGTKFWLDIERDGTIRILWKPRGIGPPQVVTFAAVQPADK